MIKGSNIQTYLISPTSSSNDLANEVINHLNDFHPVCLQSFIVDREDDLYVEPREIYYNNFNMFGVEAIISSQEREIILRLLTESRDFFNKESRCHQEFETADNFYEGLFDSICCDEHVDQDTEFKDIFKAEALRMTPRRIRFLFLLMQVAIGEILFKRNEVRKERLANIKSILTVATTYNSHI